MYPELVGYQPLLDWEPHMHEIVAQAESRADLNAAYLTQLVGHYMRTVDKYEYAERYLRWALDLFVAKLGCDHWETANARMALVMCLLDMDALSEAETAVQQAVSHLSKNSAEHTTSQSSPCIY